MFNWFKKATGPKYRIVKIGDLYVAQHYEAFIWWALYNDGTTGVAHSSVPKYMHVYGCADEEIAGKRINRHHELNYGEDVIWQN